MAVKGCLIVLAPFTAAMNKANGCLGEQCWFVNVKQVLKMLIC